MLEPLRASSDPERAGADRQGGPADPAPVAGGGRTAPLDGRGRPSNTPARNEHQLACYLLALGLAEYRAGDPDAALEVLDRPEADRTMPYPIPALAVRAMALHRLGRAEEAEARLAGSNGSSAERMPAVAGPELGRRADRPPPRPRGRGRRPVRPDLPGRPVRSMIADSPDGSAEIESVRTLLREGRRGWRSKSLPITHCATEQLHPWRASDG